MRHLPSNAERALWRASASIDSRSTPCFTAAKSGTAARLYVHDVIGGWDLDAQAFVRTVHDLDVDTIHLDVNSPGGFVFDAVSMFEALREHPAAVDVHISGLAASAASFLAMVGTTVKIAKAGRMMIHDAQGIAVGSPAEVREYADLLDAVSDDIAGFYADRAGGKAKTWRAAMTATSWYSSSQAVDAGLADRVAGTDSGPDDRTRLIQARHRALTARGG